MHSRVCLCFDGSLAGRADNALPGHVFDTKNHPELLCTLWFRHNRPLLPAHHFRFSLPIQRSLRHESRWDLTLVHTRQPSAIIGHSDGFPHMKAPPAPPSLLADHLLSLFCLLSGATVYRALILATSLASGGSASGGPQGGAVGHQAHMSISTTALCDGPLQSTCPCA